MTHTTVQQAVRFVRPTKEDQSRINLEGMRILFVVTEDWYFWSHRLPVARAARDAGARVLVAARMDNHRERIEAEGFVAIDLEINRSGLNPIWDLLTIWRLTRIYRRHRPTVVHHVAAKPVLYGSIAALLSRVPSVVNAMAGLGFLYTSNARRVRAARVLFQEVFSRLANRKNSYLIVQNTDDETLFIESGVISDRIVLIRGSGVDTEYFKPLPEPDGEVIAVCVARMLRDKGIYDLVEAARILRRDGVPIRIRLVGGVDNSPTSIAQAQLDAWSDEGTVEVAGHSADIVSEYAKAHIAVLASYREGLPKSLLEAAACGRPLVATDVPGCREICIDAETGFLVPAREPKKLAEALTAFARDRALRRRAGSRARRLAETSFSQRLIVSRTLDLYYSLR